MKIKAKLPEYLLEFLVILIGITASFVLNEWRSNRANQQAEIVALQAMRSDLVADSVTITREGALIKDQIKNFRYFLTNSTKADAQNDSLGHAIGAFATYTTLEIKNVSYEQLKATGQLGLIQNKELLGHIIDIYVNDYAIIKEYGFIDRKMVLEEYIPFLIKESPLSLIEINAGGNLLKNKGYQALVKNKIFQNMFLINMNFKSQHLKNYSDLKTKIRSVIGAIDKEMQILQ